MVRQSICFPKTTTELPNFKEKSLVYYQRLDDALDEDIAALENQQKGLNKSPSIQGQFSTLMEANVANFAKWYAHKRIDYIEKIKMVEDVRFELTNRLTDYTLSKRAH